jgi:hypothetical protein
MSELDFTREMLIALGARHDMRVWRQNVGSIPVRDRRGRVTRVFHAGPPIGASDISGIVAPEGWRLEIELKMPGGKRSKAQTVWANVIARMGGVYVLYTFDNAKDGAANLVAAVSRVTAEIDARRA